MPTGVFESITRLVESLMGVMGRGLHDGQTVPLPLYDT